MPVDRAQFIEAEVDRVWTQYRESPNLLHLIRTYVGQVADVLNTIDAIPSFFDIDSAVGHQLTLLGQRLGWPRCHCVCSTQPVFGFDCSGVVTGEVIAGFCDDNVTWLDCVPTGVSEICINEDDLYRRFLKVRRYQMLALFDRQSLLEAIQLFFGSQAMIIHEGLGRVVIAPGRQLTAGESALLQLYPRVLPIAPGVVTRFHFSRLDVFGFGEGWGGFCDPYAGEGEALETEAGANITDEFGSPIMTGPLTGDAEWMCEVDVHPYDCAA